MERRSFLKKIPTLLLFPVFVVGAIKVERGREIRANGLRLSVLETDPAYSPNAHQYKVFLDGREVLNCHTADECTGECFCYCSEDGKPSYPNGFASKILRGTVKLVKIVG